MFDDLEYVFFRVSRGGTGLWDIVPGPTATSLTIPQPPAIVNVAIFLGSSTLTGTLRGGIINWQDNIFDKGVQARYVRLEP